MLRLSQTAPAAAFVLAVGALSGGCADNESTLFIQGVLATEATECVARPDPEAAFRQLGYLDVAFGGGYVAALQVGSQITERGDREKVRTETSRMHLEGAEVTIFPTEGPSLSFASPATGFVHPASGTDPGLAAVFVQLVRPQDIAVLQGLPGGQMIARVRVYGTTLGGQEVESGEFDFPIFVCEGCLVTYPLSAQDPSSGSGTYQCGVMSGAVVDDSVICSLGQDASFPCSLCVGTYDICDSPTANPYYNPNL